jgi:hypothetical protein
MNIKEESRDFNKDNYTRRDILIDDEIISLWAVKRMKTSKALKLLIKYHQMPDRLDISTLGREEETD